MTKLVHAIYSGGVLRPLEPLEGIPENSEVEIAVEVPCLQPDLERLFGTLPREDADEMKRIVEEEFERVDQGEW
ncbi:MAG: hypothetical protein A2V83_08460 [Nitrospirae bacterium RBG_16_64_22]|nr:MAG: hypothetical protein A2V83_08460 [Nitrospirae bacterium RBG_16_64_22]